MKKKSQIKIKPLPELAKIVKEHKARGKVIVHCHGVFDLLHPGHIKHFESAKNKGDILVVTVTRDEYVNKGPDRPVFSHDLRAESIAAISCVDYVAINEWPTAIETIKLLRPSFYVKGSDYARQSNDLTGKITEEEKTVKSIGGAIYFTDDITFSSSTLLNTFFSSYPDETRAFLHDFKRCYSADDVIGMLKKIEDLKVLVIGDTIIDEYHYCAGMGKTQKDNIIAVKYLNEEVFAGGVLAAANHIAGFCKDVTILTCLGDKNDYRSFVDTHLRPNIKRQIYECRDVPTVVKRRFVDPSFLVKLFEICYLDEKGFLQKNIEKKICSYLKKNLRKFDMVLVADFGHGLITPAIVDLLCKHTKFLAVNVQTNSANIGFNLISKFPRADYICIDEPEIRLACHDKHSDLKELIAAISKKLHCPHVVITRGHHGSLAYSPKEGFESVPIFSKKVVDRIGAGDAFLSVTAPCAAIGVPMRMVGFIGNAIGAIKVLIVGNRSAVDPVQLYKYVTTLLK
jgi:rfaE bifunctional protein nucleotidyltransferase chain/domain